MEPTGPAPDDRGLDQETLFMTNASHPKDQPTATHAVPEQDSSRRPYKAPQLRHLGSVRELTLGATGSAADGGFTMMARM